VFGRVLGAEKRGEEDAKTMSKKKGENWGKQVENWANFLNPQKSRPAKKLLR